MADALVLEGPRRLSKVTLPLPPEGDDDGVLRVEACGLCGTDHEQYTGALAAAASVVPGHETVGVIERVGPAAAERWGVAEGDRVAVAVFQSCRSCDMCEGGQQQRCRRHGLRDMYGFITVDRPPGLWGGYATHHYLAPDSVLWPVPPELDPVLATLFNPVGAGIRWGSTLPGTKEGDVVAVLGPGIRGLAVVAAARDAGAGFVMVTGFGDRDAGRLEWARRFGADLTVDVAREDPVAALRNATGQGADVVVDVTAKAPAALAQAVALARSAGTIVLAGTRGTDETPGFWPDLIVFKELRILGALGVDAASYQAALALVASGRYPFADLPRQTARLGEVEELLLSMGGEGTEPPPVHGVIVP